MYFEATVKVERVSEVVYIVFFMVVLIVYRELGAIYVYSGAKYPNPAIYIFYTE